MSRRSAAETVRQARYQKVAFRLNVRPWPVLLSTRRVSASWLPLIALAAPYRDRMAVLSAVVGDELLLLVDGVIDGAVAPELHRHLSAADHLSVRSVVVDLACAPHIDEGGIAVLAAAAHVLGARAVPLWLHLSHSRTVRVTDAATLRTLLSPDGQAEPA